MNGVIVKRGDWFPSFFDRFWNDELCCKTADDCLPAVNVTETPKEFKIDLSAPGFAKKDVKVAVDKNVLTISAERESKSEETDSENRVIRQEFSQSSFCRSFTLPENVDAGSINAQLTDGVLALVLPKLKNAPEDTVRKVEVK